MAIEYGMYFALGFLAAALIALAIGPAFWRRAVRLTKRRIQAATPVTLAEFRADKDKIRAEFAIALRRREIRIEQLREQLVAAKVALDAVKTDLSALKSERDEQFSAIEAYKLREEELTVRLRDLERDNATLSASLRQAESGYGGIAPESAEPVTAGQLSGDYRSDVEDLLMALSIERQRSAYLEDQSRMLLQRLEKKKGARQDEAIALLRDTLDADTNPQSGSRLDLRRAEARIAGAEDRLNALLDDRAAEYEAPSAKPSSRSLAEEFSREEQEARIRAEVEGLEASVSADWQTERFDASALRQRLSTIALDVSRLIYSEGTEDEAQSVSLFDRVAKYAAEGGEVEHLTRKPETERSGAVASRMDAMRDRLASQ